MTIIRAIHRANKFNITILYIGFIVSIIILSTGISIVQESEESQMRTTSGDPGDISIFRITPNKVNSNSFKYSTLDSILLNFKDYTEMQIGFEGGRINNKNESTIVGVLYSKKPKWQPPLIWGKHFEISETRSSAKIAIVGKNIKQYLEKINNNYNLLMNNEKFTVIGIIGDGTKSTQWDDFVYVPLRSIPNDLKNTKQEYFNINLKNEDANLDESVKLLQSDLENKIADSIVESKKIENISSGEKNNSLITTGVVSAIILIISCINVVNLSLFWVLDRRKEFGIRKAVGATNERVALQIISELLFIAITAVILALIIQFCIIRPIINNYFHLDLYISYTNIFLSSITIIFSSLISSIIPVNASLKIEPVDAIRK